MAVNSAIKDVVPDNLNLPVTTTYLEAHGSLHGLATGVHRLNGSRRAGEAMLAVFGAFDECRVRTTLFDFSRVLTRVHPAPGDLAEEMLAALAE